MIDWLVKDIEENNVTTTSPEINSNFNFNTDTKIPEYGVSGTSSFQPNFNSKYFQTQGSVPGNNYNKENQINQMILPDTNFSNYKSTLQNPIIDENKKTNTYNSLNNTDFETNSI